MDFRKEAEEGKILLLMDIVFGVWSGWSHLVNNVGHEVMMMTGYPVWEDTPYDMIPFENYWHSPHLLEFFSASCVCKLEWSSSTRSPTFCFYPAQALKQCFFAVIKLLPCTA